MADRVLIWSEIYHQERIYLWYDFDQRRGIIERENGRELRISRNESLTFYRLHLLLVTGFGTRSYD